MKQNTIFYFEKLVLLIVVLLSHFLVQAQTTQPFITTWQTTVANEEITIPTKSNSGPYNYTVDWGDGTIDTDQTGNATHTYAAAGEYEVKITGDFPQIYFNGREGSDKIQAVTQWGDIQWKSMRQAFKGCSNLEVTATDAPDLSQVEFMSEMFSGATAFNGDIGGWDISKVKSLAGMFSGATSFNQDIGNWDISKVVSLSLMFSGATTFNQDISGWNVSSVIIMRLMFEDAISFNQDIGSWDVSKVTTMQRMFRGATSFNQDLGSWTSNATRRHNMFDGSGLDCSNYSATLIGWEANTPVSDVNLGAADRTYGSQATDARAALIDRGWTISGDILNPGCSNETRPFITTWQTTVDNEEITIPTKSNSGPYNYTVDWGDGTIDTDQTGNATHEYSSPGEYEVKITGDFPHIYFNGREGSDKIQAVTQWGDIRWKNMQQAFKGCSNLEVTATDAPDLSQVVFMTEMFSNATAFNGDIGGWDISNVESLSGMFSNATSFNQDISSWDMSNIKSTTLMFMGATTFNQDISDWNVSSVIIMRLMFEDAISFNQDIGSWDVSKVTTMQRMFRGAISFNQDLGSWTSNATHRYNMFDGSGLDCSNYSATLVGWANNTSASDVQLGADGMEYGTDVSDAINELITNRNWIINDHESSGGKCLSFEIARKLFTETVTLLNAGNVQVYPNPVKEQLNIVLDSNHGKIQQMVIRMVSGQVLRRKTVSQGDLADEGVLSVDISNLATGMYLLEVQGIETSSIFRTKFFKQ